MVRIGHSFDTEAQALAAQESVDEAVGLPSGGYTLNHVDVFPFGSKWALEHCPESEELFGTPEEFEFTDP